MIETKEIIKTNPMPVLSQDDINRFWSKVDITANPDKCWMWNGGKAGVGRKAYGRFSITVSKEKSGYPFIAIRVMYFLYYGVDPMGKLVMHSCDNPSCTNPHHLSLGTTKSNSDDRDKKGRNKIMLGVKHGQSKLNDDIVREIKKRVLLGEKYGGIAREFGVNQSVISRIANNKAWVHIQ